MVKVRLPREPYEGQIYYDPENELIFLYEKGRWIDVTDLDIAKTDFSWHNWIITLIIKEHIYKAMKTNLDLPKYKWQILFDHLKHYRENETVNTFSV